MGAIWSSRNRLRTISSSCSSIRCKLIKTSSLGTALREVHLRKKTRVYQITLHSLPKIELSTNKMKIEMRFKSTTNKFSCGSSSTNSNRQCKWIKSNRTNNNTKQCRKCWMLNSTLKSKTCKSSTKCKCKCTTNSNSNHSYSMKLTKVWTYQPNHLFQPAMILFISKM